MKVRVRVRIRQAQAEGEAEDKGEDACVQKLDHSHCTTFAMLLIMPVTPCDHMQGPHLKPTSSCMERAELGALHAREQMESKTNSNRVQAQALIWRAM